MMRGLFLAVLFCLLSGASLADEIRPAYLELEETATDTFSILWKLPAKGDKKLALNVALPDNCSDQPQGTTQFINAAYIQRWLAGCPGGLPGKSISISGMETTITDVMLRIEFLNGDSQSALLTPEKPLYEVSQQASATQLAGTYTWLGFTHILGGVDHLLFVFALLLIVSNLKRLLWTVTAFTLAHSITLAASTLELVQVPQAPVEAVIALSILFLAMEIVHARRGSPGAAARWPWLVAFLFGLLHGFGFAGALAEVGLPQQAIPLALVFFNVGVELGQISFILLVLSLGWLLKKLHQPGLLRLGETAMLYLIGGLSSFWLFERIAAF